jgi:hypothetical protein
MVVGHDLGHYEENKAGLGLRGVQNAKPQTSFQSLGKEGPAAWNPVITGDGDSTISSFVADGKFSTGWELKNGRV